jgi:hypothetical protein
MTSRPGGRSSGSKHQPGEDVNGSVSHEGLSLRGEAGRQVAINLARLALGQTSIKELNDPRYSLTPGGAISLDLDDDSIAALEAVKHG